MVAAVVGVVAAPSVAFALPNPFMVALGVEMVAQLALVAFLTIPAAVTTLRSALYRRIPSATGRNASLALVVGTLGLITSASIRPPRPIAVPSASLHERLARCRPATAAQGRRWGVAPGTVVVDPRPAGAFAAYRLDGSCNLSRAELGRAAVRAHLEGLGGRVAIAADSEVYLPAFLGEAEPPAGLALEPLPGGLQIHYKEADDATVAWGPVSHAVVDAEGHPVQVQLGPWRTMSSYRSVLGRRGSWRRLGGAAVPAALAEGATVIDVREPSACAPGTLCVPPWDARVATVAPQSDAGSRWLLICATPSSCLAAEALAHEAGRRVLGYVRTLREGDALTRPRAALPLPVWLLLALVFGVSLGATLPCEWAARRLPALEPIRGALPALLAGAALALPSLSLVAAGADPLRPGPVALYLVDAVRLGQGGWLALLPVGGVLAVALGERRLGRRSRWLRLTVVLVALVILQREMQSQSEHGLRLLSLAALVAALAGTALADALGHVRGRLALRGEGARVVPLGAAWREPFVGEKARALGRARWHGLRIPETLVLRLVPAELDARQADALAATLRRRFGARPLAIRSSAPGEDAPGALCAGRFHSGTCVGPEETASAIAAVVGSYVAGGVRPDAVVAVLVQPWMEGPLAGVAIGRGPGPRPTLEVEADPGDNRGITAGRGAALRDAIGGVSGAWVLGPIEDAGIAPNALRRLYERLTLLQPGPLDLEWSRDRHGVVLLQARRAPAVSEGEAARLLAQLRGRLGWRRAKANLEVLARGSLADFPSPTSRATEELLEDLLGSAEARRSAATLLGARAFAPAPTPAVVRLGGRLYENRLSDRPLRALLAEPLHRLARRWLRLWRGRVRRRLREAVARLEAESVEPLDARDLPAALAAAEAARRALLGRPAAVALAVGMWRAIDSSVSAGTDGDPMLHALGRGASDAELAERFGDRALPDLALEQPRLGEGRSTAPPATDSDDLRGRTRVVLAKHAGRLRLAMLRLGELAGIGEGIFEVPHARWATLEPGAEPPVTDTGTDDAPLSITLGMLEAWALLGRPPAGAASAPGVWIGRPRRVAGVVRFADEDDEPLEARPVLVLGQPTPAALRDAPQNAFVIARGGSALCHAALIARERGIEALFGVGGVADELRAGDRVAVDRRGRVRRLTGGDVSRG